MINAKNVLMYELTAKAVEYGNEETLGYLMGRGYSPYYHDNKITVEPDVQTCIFNDSVKLLKKVVVMAPVYFANGMISAAECVGDADIFKDFYNHAKYAITDLTPFCNCNTDTGKALFDFAVENGACIKASVVYSGVAKKYLDLGGGMEEVLRGIIADKEAYTDADFLRALAKENSADFGEYGHSIFLQAVRAGCCDTVKFMIEMGYSLDYERMYKDSNINEFKELAYMTDEMRQILERAEIPIYSTREAWESRSGLGLDEFD